jgi:hypothetical protein
MKTEDIGVSGKFGSRVMWTGPNGTVSRRFVIPRNPRTERQLEVRGHLAEQSRRYNQLTDEQQQAWEAAAAGYRSTPRLGQSGPLTGFLLFIRVNCKLTLLGLEPVDTPPPPPVFPELAAQNLVISNLGGVIALKLVWRADPAAYTVLRASPPQSPGVRTCQHFRIIGLCPAPVAGEADITALYLAQFGSPPVGKRIFVRVSTMMSGFESLPGEFHARVPAS